MILNVTCAKNSCCCQTIRHLQQHAVVSCEYLITVVIFLYAQ
jgi:hypothetical protein